jgi:hypothetical protein
MAKLILTGEFEAIDLKYLRGQQLLKLEQQAEEMTRKNGGFARFMLWLKRGVFDLMEVCETISIRIEKKPPTA